MMTYMHNRTNLNYVFLIAREYETSTIINVLI